MYKGIQVYKGTPLADTNADGAAVATCPRGAPQVLFLNFANVFESSPSSPHLPLNSPIIVMFSKAQNDVSTFSMFNVCFTISPFLVGLLFTLLYSTMCILSTIVRFDCFYACHGSYSCTQKI